METIYQQIVETLNEQLKTNQFLSGGAVLMVLGAVAAVCRHLPGRMWRWFVRRLFMEVEIPMRDDAFWWFNDWLADHHYSKRWARWLSVRTIRKGRRDTDRPNIILSPAPGTHWLWWKGYFCVVNRDRKENENTPGTSSMGMAMSVQQEVFNISILTWRRNVIMRLLEEARAKAYPPDDDRLTIYSPRYGEWDSEMRRRPRPANSVLLPDGLLESLIKDVERFISSEQWYVDRGIPYRRGFLLYGPPGNGKSSAVAAIASELKLDICIINLGTSSLGDDDLTALMSKIPQHAILLIEDIDCVFEQRKSTEDNESKITFSGLLNALDGVVASEGRILFMTTNHIEKLDPALIRPGRCDRRVLIENAARSQAKRLFTRFFPDQQDLAERFGDLVEGGKFSMASLQGHLLKYADHPDWAISNFGEIRGIISESQAANEGTEPTEGKHGIQTQAGSRSVA